MRSNDRPMQVTEDRLNRARAALAQPEPQGPTDEELETTARAAEIQYMKEQGGLAGLTPDGLHAQLQAQRLAGLRAVAARWGRPAIEPVPVAPTNLDAEFRSWYGDRYGRSYFGGIALVECVEWTQFVLARWGRPAIEPVPVSAGLPGPTDEELLKAYSRAVAADIDEQHRALQHINGGANAPDRDRAIVTGLRAVLARYARPAIEPVPVSDPPGPEDCDAEGSCWLHQPHPATPETPEWRLMPARYASTIYGTTHWLPHWALPVPAPANTINQEN
jgi:hypothetical protein